MKNKLVFFLLIFFLIGMAFLVSFLIFGEVSRASPGSCPACPPFICLPCLAPPPTCGNGAMDAGEDCDIGLDLIPGTADDVDAACPGQCQADCTCPVVPPPPTCGNGAMDAGEDCDIGLDLIPGTADDVDAACPGQCQADCTCLAPPPGCPACPPFTCLPCLGLVPPPSCVPDGCNGNCPANCTVAEDPDCGCEDDDDCCGIECDFTNDNNCLLPGPCMLAECPCPRGECLGGLVPCGRTCDDPTTTNVCECCPCTLCHLFVLFKRIIDEIVMPYVFLLAVLMIVVGGIILQTASGDPGRIIQGKKLLKTAIIGVAIILVSWLVIDTIIVFLTPAGSPFQAWHTINCPVP